MKSYDVNLFEVNTCFLNTSIYADNLALTLIKASPVQKSLLFDSC